MIRSKYFITAASLAFVSAALISGESFARDTDGGRHGRSHDDALVSLLERLDSNADGVLSQGEFSVRTAVSAQRRFNKRDTNTDELLSFGEFAAAARHHRRRPNLDTLDTHALEQCVVQALGYGLPKRPDPETAFADADANSDGAIDLEESLAAADLRADDRFAEIDGDSSEQLTSDEIDSYQELRSEQREAHRSCVREQLDEENLLN